MIHRFAIGLVVLATAIHSLKADDVRLPSDLATVPSDALGFVHLRVSDILKSEALKDFRGMLQKAGPKALAAFDSRFVPAPSTIERVTIVILNPEQVQRAAPFVGLIACSENFDKAKALASLLPKGKEQKSMTGKSYFEDEELEMAIRIVDDRTLAVASPDAMRIFLDQKKPDVNLMTPAIRTAAGSNHLVVAFNTGLIPNDVTGELPEPLQPIARAKLAQLAMSVNKTIDLDVRLTFADEAQAKAGETAVRNGLTMARDAIKEAKKHFEMQLQPKELGKKSSIEELPEAVLSVLALGGLELVDEFVRDLPVRRDGSTLASNVSISAGPYTAMLGMGAMSAGFALPAVTRTRMAANNSRSANNLKQIMLAMHNYHDVYNGFPAAAICDKNGKPLLSWRVAILPFIEEDNLYKQFRLDEPWDSDHNKKLIARMPKVYMVPNVSKPGDIETHYRVFYGRGAAFDLKKPVRLVDYTDGTSNTVVVVEAAEAVAWTKPDDFEYDPKKPLPKFGRSSPDGFWVAMGDGSVRFVPNKVKEESLRGALTRNGGEIVNLDDK